METLENQISIVSDCYEIVDVLIHWKQKKLKIVIDIGKLVDEECVSQRRHIIEVTGTQFDTIISNLVNKAYAKARIEAYLGEL